MRPNRVVLFFAFLLAPGFLFAQEAIHDPLLHWMNHIAQQQLQQRQREIDKIHTVADAEQRKKIVHEKLLKLLGGLPDDSGPLNQA